MGLVTLLTHSVNLDDVFLSADHGRSGKRIAADGNSASGINHIISR